MILWRRVGEKGVGIDSVVKVVIKLFPGNRNISWSSLSKFDVNVV